MKRILAVALVAIVLGISAVALKGNAVDAAATPKKVLRHIVLFKFTDDASAKEVSEALAALEGKIDVIKGFEWGTNVSKEGLDKGLTHGFTFTFQTQEDLDTYIAHEAHKAFVASLDGKVADVCVFDYWTDLK